MKAQENLSKVHSHTLQLIFQHPISHNLEWREVLSLFEALGTVEQEGNREVKFRVAGESQTFQSPQHKDVTDAQEIMDLRHFLQRVRVTP